MFTFMSTLSLDATEIELFDTIQELGNSQDHESKMNYDIDYFMSYSELVQSYTTLCTQFNLTPRKV